METKGHSSCLELNQYVLKVNLPNNMPKDSSVVSWKLLQNLPAILPKSVLASKFLDCWSLTESILLSEKCYTYCFSIIIYGGTNKQI